MILDKKLSVDRVATRVSEEYEEFLNVMFSDENAEQLVLRIRIMADPNQKGEDGGEANDETLKKVRVESGLFHCSCCSVEFAWDGREVRAARVFEAGPLRPQQF